MGLFLQRFSFLLITFILLLSGCTVTQTVELQAVNTPQHLATRTALEITLEPATIPLPSQTRPPIVEHPVFGFTYHRPDGNRLVAGKGNLPAYQPVDIALDGTPIWLVAASTGKEGVWVAALENGKLQAYIVRDGVAQQLPTNPTQLPVGMPPVLVLQNGSINLLQAPQGDFATYSHPVPLNGTGTRLAHITRDGDLVVWNGNEVARLPVQALPDARLLVDENQRILLLTDPTSRYDHGVLGDSLEAASLTIVETYPIPQVVKVIELPEPAVIEGIAPVWTDIDGDGWREILVTVSDMTSGARLVVYHEDGSQDATGPAVGRSYRWRNQLAVVPWQGGFSVIDVLTPHLDGIVEFYDLAGRQLNVAASLPGYTSHVIGTRNLDMALAGDFDGDGDIEALMPNLARTTIAAIRRTDAGADEVWTLPLQSPLSTNLAALSFSDGTIALGVGQDNGVLRIWTP